MLSDSVVTAQLKLPQFAAPQFVPCVAIHIRYWHPVFTVWRADRRSVRVRYHPEDLSRVYVSADGKHYIEARYADLCRPSITLWEQRAAVRWLREQDHPRLSEVLLFKAIE